MKRLAIVAIVLTAILGGVALTQIDNEPVEFTAPQVIEKEVEVDLIQKAQEELERINQELDAEEQKLLQEIEERKTRIENIHKTRASFQ
jgi:phosphopantothenate synthetase